MRSIFLLLFLNFSLLAEYGWLEEVVGIDKKEFNYVEGSDKELEVYTKKHSLQTSKCLQMANI